MILRNRRFLLLIQGVLFVSMLSLAGCAAMEKTGEVGNKNLRPYEPNEYQKNGLRLNGTHSYGSPTYRQGVKEYNVQDRWMLRNRMGNNWIGAHGNDRLAMNGAAASRLKSLSGVEEAYVLLADERAYVGIVEKDAKSADVAGISDSRRHQIVETVRKAIPAVRKVYITSNPEYIERMHIYEAAEKSGHSVQDFAAEFNALAARIFPDVSYVDADSKTGR